MSRPPWLTRGKAFALMLMFVAIVLLSYAFYFVYDNWPFLRFLLPAIPLLFILVAAVIVGLLQRVPAEFRRAFICVLCLLVPCAYLENADRLRIFDNRRAERRYAAVGVFVKWRLPPNAVVVTVMESGSLRFYGARPTLRWDYIAPTQLDAVLETMRAHGYERYILLESSEEDEFRTRFGGSSVVGRVDWPPTIEYFGPSDVRIYAVEDRAQYVAGRRNLPRAVPSE
jgi:hypothetical protein